MKTWLQHHPYHKLLRGAALLLAVALLFDSGLLSPITRQLSDQAQRHVANVIGVGAAVEPTELNTLTAELTKQRVALEARERAVAEREIAVDVRGQREDSASDGVSTYILSILLFIILVLIVLNYSLDFMRERHLRELALHKQRQT